MGDNQDHKPKPGITQSGSDDIDYFANYFGPTTIEEEEVQGLGPTEYAQKVSDTLVDILKQVGAICDRAREELQNMLDQSKDLRGSTQSVTESLGQMRGKLTTQITDLDRFRTAFNSALEPIAYTYETRPTDILSHVLNFGRLVRAVLGHQDLEALLREIDADLTLGRVPEDEDSEHEQEDSEHEQEDSEHEDLDEESSRATVPKDGLKEGYFVGQFSNIMHRYGSLLHSVRTWNASYQAKPPSVDT
ncbi:hypothetical protein M231_03680 [Tremella mesenterica]|uniref:Uncharacterized protein n=1 Tax=Tremella mesenterica TaxID=5217 RepID=A0A4Q1BML3_TREME|nr:hypothetical protein M231_03680 [Tremella mesenterica]